MSDNMFLTSASGTVGSAAVEVGIDLDVRYMAIAWGELSIVKLDRIYIASIFYITVGIVLKYPAIIGACQHFLGIAV